MCSSDLIPTPRTEIDHGSDRRRKGLDEAQRMVNDLVDGSGPQHADAPGFAQRIDQTTSVVSREMRHQAWAGVITTRRLGSSPSEWVAMSERPVRASCTILRSDDGMASRARGVPVDTTSSAT